MEIDKRIRQLSDRLTYIRDILAVPASASANGTTAATGNRNENVALMAAKLDDFVAREPGMDTSEKVREINKLEDLFGFLESKLEDTLTPMDRVRIVRHPQRVTLKDILENVYDNYTEIGGQDEYSIDPSMLIARAYLARRVGKKIINQPVMVIGQEKGHNEDFRNGGSVKPWGNAKALHYMKVAETENIPIHTYVFTPGSFPIEDSPGAAQQIAQNLYEMAGLKVPVVTIISEGGSGGAEAIGLADKRLMLSHGYYSVISPEGAAAIEGRVRAGQRAPEGLVEKCATQLKLTAEDNLRMGYVDQVIAEPDLGARVEHFDFYKTLRDEVIGATNEVVLNVKGFKFFRKMALSRRSGSGPAASEAQNVFVRWTLSTSARERLINRRHRKFRKLAQHAYIDNSDPLRKVKEMTKQTFWSLHSYFRYEFWGKWKKKLTRLGEEIYHETLVLRDKVAAYLREDGTPNGQEQPDEAARESLTELSEMDEGSEPSAEPLGYLSPRAREDKTITCPRADLYGCQDLWAPDLFGDFAGVCSHCGFHFSMEYQWYLHNLFEYGTINTFNDDIESANPLGFEGLDEKIAAAKKKTGSKSGCMTFEAEINGIKLVVAMLMAPFRGGTVGAAEGEKFIRAVERAKKKHYPLLAYVHGTAGIRIQEGVNGVIQMPRCTMAVRRYIEDGGLYIVLYDTNSYAGPVASFLGCSPYQFSVRSANIGFAGVGVIKETTGMDIPPDYHQAHQALSRGHIQDIWDRGELKGNLHQALLTMGGRNLYYR